MAPNTEIEIITQEKHADKVVNALKALVKTALCNGFSKTSYLITDHIKYIKKIHSSDNPEAYIRFTARKLFPNEPAYLEKIEKIHAKYQDDVLSRFEDLYALYYQLSKELPKRRKITSTEADDILAELLI